MTITLSQDDIECSQGQTIPNEPTIQVVKMSEQTIWSLCNILCVPVKGTILTSDQLIVLIILVILYPYFKT